MFSKFYILLFAILLASCINNPEFEPQKIEKWTVVGDYRGDTYCFFTLDSVEIDTSIPDAFLGWDNKAEDITIIQFKSGGEFTIFVNEETLLLGTWTMKDQRFILLQYKDESWKLEIIYKGLDSMIVKAEYAEPYLRNVQITLTH